MTNEEIRKKVEDVINKSGIIANFSLSQFNGDVASAMSSLLTAFVMIAKVKNPNGDIRQLGENVVESMVDQWDKIVIHKE